MFFSSLTKPLSYQRLDQFINCIQECNWLLGLWVVIERFARFTEDNYLCFFELSWEVFQGLVGISQLYYCFCQFRAYSLKKAVQDTIGSWGLIQLPSFQKTTNFVCYNLLRNVQTSVLKGFFFKDSILNIVQISFYYRVKPGLQDFCFFINRVNQALG